VYIFSGSDEEYKNIYSDIAVLRFSGPSAEDLKVRLRECECECITQLMDCSRSLG